MRAMKIVPAAFNPNQLAAFRQAQADLALIRSWFDDDQMADPVTRLILEVRLRWIAQALEIASGAFASAEGIGDTPQPVRIDYTRESAPRHPV